MIRPSAKPRPIVCKCLTISSTLEKAEDKIRRYLDELSSRPTPRVIAIYAGFARSSKDKQICSDWRTLSARAAEFGW